MESALLQIVLKIRLAMRHHYAKNQGHAFAMVLYRIHQMTKSGPVTVTRLAKDANISLAASAQMTKMLISQGFLEKRRSREDARVWLLTLKQKGQDAVAEIERRLQKTVADLELKLGKQDSDELERILNRVYDYLLEKPEFEGDLL